MIRHCERAGCEVTTRRRRFCSDRCASSDRQRRYRERDGVTQEIELRGVSVKIEHSQPEAFGVPTIGDVAFIFADDAERFRRLGYVS